MQAALSQTTKLSQVQATDLPANEVQIPGADLAGVVTECASERSRVSKPPTLLLTSAYLSALLRAQYC